MIMTILGVIMGMITMMLIFVTGWIVAELIFLALKSIGMSQHDKKKTTILPPESQKSDARQTVQGFYQCDICENMYLVLSMHDIETHVCRKVPA